MTRAEIRKLRSDIGSAILIAGDLRLDLHTARVRPKVRDECDQLHRKLKDIATKIDVSLGGIGQ